MCGIIYYSFFLSFRFAFLRFFRSLPRCHGTLNSIGPLLLPFAPGSWMCWTFTAESWRELRISTDATEDRAQIWCWIMVAQLTTNSRGLFHSSLHLEQDEQGDFNGFHVRFLITRGQSSFSVIFPIEITIGYPSFRPIKSHQDAPSPPISAAFFSISAWKKGPIRCHQKSQVAMNWFKQHLNWKPWKPWFLPPKYRGFNVFNPNISQEAIVLSFASWPHHQRNLPPPQDEFEALKSGYDRSIPWIIHFPIDFSHFSPRGFRIQRHHFRRI